MGPEFQKTLAELSGLGSAVSKAIGIGLGRTVNRAATNVVQNYLTGQVLKTRSHALKEAVQGWMVSDTEGIVGVQPNSAVDKYAWLLGDEQHWIYPHKGMCLTIPVGEALTDAGVAKWPSVKEAEAALGVKLFRPRGMNVLGYIRGKSKLSKFRPLFVLVESVFVQGTGALADGILESIETPPNLIQDEVDKVLGNG